MTQFEILKREIVSSSFPSSGDNLTGMQVDFEYYLAASRLLRNVFVQSIGMEPGTLHAVADFSGSLEEVGELGNELRSIWLSQLRYGYLEAHEIISESNYTTLRFITQIDADGFYVTGRIRVRHES